MTTHKMESLIYTYFKNGSLVIVPKISKNNYWFDNETMLWKEIVNKNEDVYFPLLEAFKAEILDQNRKNIKLLENMLKYLLGKFDFYKVISIEQK